MNTVWIRAALTIILASTTVILCAQNSGSSGLVIQVSPESHLDTPLASLSFEVRHPGEIAYSQPVTVLAWVRAIPNQQIRLTALPQSFNGPLGAASPASLRWTASMSRATGGAAAATCIGGNFGSAGPQPLISNWTHSGIARCTFTFALPTDFSWPAGVYSGSVSLKLTAE